MTRECSGDRGRASRLREGFRAGGLLVILAHGASAAAGAHSSKLVARGKYVVEEMAMCQECHTPRDASGALDRHQWLKGGAVFFRPAVPVANWAEEAPAIGGLPGWSDADAIYFLENGRRRTGEVPRPPMKRYRLEHGDARAIVAYLRSLAREVMAVHEPTDAVLPAER